MSGEHSTYMCGDILWWWWHQWSIPCTIYRWGTRSAARWGSSWSGASWFGHHVCSSGVRNDHRLSILVWPIRNHDLQNKHRSGSDRAAVWLSPIVRAAQIALIPTNTPSVIGLSRMFTFAKLNTHSWSALWQWKYCVSLRLRRLTDMNPYVQWIWRHNFSTARRR